MEYIDIRSRLSALYGERGSSPRVGYGQYPAVLVVDMVKVFTQPGTPLVCPLESEIKQIKRILAVARSREVPIIFSTVIYNDPIECGIWIKKTPFANLLGPDSELTEVDERLERQPSESLLIKNYPSCFFGTDLVSRLVYQQIDTLIIVGCSTSGCVRATAVDACSYGFHTVLVAEAVGDRADAPHIANLFDIDAKYGDVVSVEDVLKYLEENGVEFTKHSLNGL
jgi:maleamate amidohydrolase